MKRFIPLLVVILVIVNIFISCWYVFNRDINFTSDIARDFFILNEISVKKFILIGPNSSTGLFHGPLWAYLNYPSYLVGNGNPVIVGWNWIMLDILFIASGYLIGKNLFNRQTGFLFALMLSLYMFYHVNGLFNPHGAMFVLPAFFYFYIRYLQTGKLKYLILHLILAGSMIQFQMAIGLPMTVLSAAGIIIKIIRSRKVLHSLLLIIIPFSIGNFIIFDLRHEHLLSKLLTHYLTSAGRDHPDYIALVLDRIKLMLSSPEILRRDPGNINLALFATTLIFIAIQIKNKKFRDVYLHFLYFYAGFYILSIFNTGPLLYFYLFPLFPLVFLVFSSMLTAKFSKLFMLLFTIVYVLNFQNAFYDIRDSGNIIGKSIYSWNFLHSAAEKVYQGPEKEFGYFVYAPNTLAYEGKYAMFYAAKEFPRKMAIANIKKPVTYLFAAPPPPNNPYMQDAWWRINKMKHDGKPEETIKFANGYKIERYLLNTDEVQIPPDPNIDPGLFFR